MASALATPIIAVPTPCHATLRFQRRVPRTAAAEDRQSPDVCLCRHGSPRARRLPVTRVAGVSTRAQTCQRDDAAAAGMGRDVDRCDALKGRRHGGGGGWRWLREDRDEAAWTPLGIWSDTAWPSTTGPLCRIQSCVKLCLPKPGATLKLAKRPSAEHFSAAVTETPMTPLRTRVRMTKDNDNSMSHMRRQAHGSALSHRRFGICNASVSPDLVIYIRRFAAERVRVIQSCKRGAARGQGVQKSAGIYEGDEIRRATGGM